MSLMDDLLSSAEWSPTNFLGASLTLGADQTYNTDKTSLFQPSTAIDMMTKPSTDPSYGQWGQFFLDTVKAGVGYVIAKDAQQSGVQTPQQQALTPQQYAQLQQQRGQAASMPLNLGGMLPLLLIGGLLVFALKD
jgi:hypothetical protein